MDRSLLDESVLEDEDLDPRVQHELDILNQTSEEINRLENELDEARTNYKITFTEASQRMAQVAQKKRRNIKKARAFFELKEEAKQAQGESLKAARQYQSAISVYRAAKETVTLAEERLLQKGEGQLSAAWQEMMNHATKRVMDAEAEKRESENRHQKATSRCANCEQRMHSLEKKFKKSIIKATPYFEVKQELDIKLQQQKQNVSDLQSAIKSVKMKYSQALHNLEKISEEIHEGRRQKLLLMFPRQPGVGAESGSSLASTVPEMMTDDLPVESFEDTDHSCEDTEDDSSADRGVLFFSLSPSLSEQHRTNCIESNPKRTCLHESNPKRPSFTSLGECVSNDDTIDNVFIDSNSLVYKDDNTCNLISETSNMDSEKQIQDITSAEPDP